VVGMLCNARGYEVQHVMAPEEPFPTTAV